MYAVGDITVIPLKMGRPLPKAGVFAHGEAEVVAHNIATAWAGRGKPRRFEGKGMCFIETGGARAGMGSGNFYAEPRPDVRLHAPSLLWHGAKVLYEKYWIRRLTMPGTRRARRRRAARDVAQLQPSPVVRLRSAVIGPKGGGVARALERVLPNRLLFGGFLALASRRL